MKNKVLKAYTESIEPIDEGVSETKNFIDANVREMDDRAIVYLMKIGTAMYEIILNMKELKRVLLHKHYKGIADAIKKDIGTL